METVQHTTRGNSSLSEGDENAENAGNLARSSAAPAPQGLAAVGGSRGGCESLTPSRVVVLGLGVEFPRTLREF